MATRDVAAATCAKALSRLNATILNSEMMTRWAQALAVRTRTLRPRTRQTANSVTAPKPAVNVRMVNGGIASRAIFITGQVMPQSRHRLTTSSRPWMSPAADVPAGVWSLGISLSSGSHVPRRTIAHRKRPEHRERDGTDAQRDERGPRLAGEVPQRPTDGRNDDCARITDRKHTRGGARHVAGRDKQCRQ